MSAFRQQVARALQVDWETSTAEVERSLALALERPNELLVNGEFVQAGELYRVFLEELNAAYRDGTPFPELDNDGDLSLLANEACEQLGECLAFVEPTEAARSSWLQALWQSYCQDLELGGVDYAAASGELLSKLATAAEWQQLAAEIEAYRTSLPPKSWIADSLEQLLAARSP